MTNEIFHIFETSLFSLTLLLHIFGMYLLAKYSNGVARNQRLYLVSLSASEILLALHHIIINTVQFITSFPLPNTIWLTVMQIIHYDGVWIINFGTMIMLTLDRLAEVLLNIKYPLYVTRRKTILVLLTVWLVGIITVIMFTTLYFTYNVNYFDISYRYIYPVLDTAVVLTAIFVYSYIYVKLRRNKRCLPKFNRSVHMDQCAVNRSNKRKFFAPFLILITFLVFIYIPDVIHFTNMHLLKNQVWFKRICAVLYAMNMISDATIYIFLQKSIRKVIVRTLTPQSSTDVRTTTFDH